MISWKRFFIAMILMIVALLISETRSESYQYVAAMGILLIYVHGAGKQG